MSGAVSIGGSESLPAQKEALLAMVGASPTEARCTSVGRLDYQIWVLAFRKPFRGRHAREESLRRDEPRRNRPGIHACPPLENLQYLGKRFEGSAGVAELERRIDYTARLLRESQQATPSPQIADGLSGIHTEEVLDLFRMKKRSYMLRPYCFCGCDQGSAPPEPGGITDVRRNSCESQLTESALERLRRCRNE